MDLHRFAVAQYNGADAGDQLNKSGETYYWLAIG